MSLTDADRPNSELIAIAAFLYITLALCKAPVLALLGGGWFWFGDVVCFVAVPALLMGMLAGWRWRRIPVVWQGLQRQVHPPSAVAFWCVVATLAFFAVDQFSIRVGIRLARSWSGAWPALLSYATHLEPHGIVRWVQVMYMAFSAALVEETVFRGLLYRWFLPQKATASRVVAYVTVSTALFASVHWSHGVVNLVEAIGVGLLAACMYHRLGSLLPLVTAHFWVDVYWLSR